jgi:hypothetical protein
LLPLRGVFLSLYLVSTSCGGNDLQVAGLQALDSESEIRDRAFRLVRAIGSATSEERRTQAENELRRIADGLSLGWPGFQVSGYHPSGYSEEDLLGEIYWDLARTSTTSGTRNRYELMTVLHDLKPPSDRFRLAEMWDYAVRHHGLETLAR